VHTARKETCLQKLKGKTDILYGNNKKSKFKYTPKNLEVGENLIQRQQNYKKEEV
jgi:hypothetical protein